MHNVRFHASIGEVYGKAQGILPLSCGMLQNETTRVKAQLACIQSLGNAVDDMLSEWANFKVLTHVAVLMVQDKIEAQTKEVMEQLRHHMRPKGTLVLAHPAVSICCPQSFAAAPGCLQQPA